MDIVQPKCLAPSPTGRFFVINESLRGRRSLKLRDYRSFSRSPKNRWLAETVPKAWERFTVKTITTSGARTSANRPLFAPVTM